MALTRGAVLVTPTYATWGIAGRCKRPLNVEHDGYGHMQGSALRDPEWQPSRVLSTEVACRQCSACLKARAYYWGTRAVREFQQAPRTWFGTLTFAPEERYRFTATTRRRLDAQGIDLSGLPPVERYRELARETGPQVTNYLKALRKGRKRRGLDPVRFRYLLTVEPHKDWTPHYHLLVHEVSELMPVRKKALDAMWPHGYVQWRLVDDPKAAFYAAKYLSKYSVARVRASEYYGDVEQETISNHKGKSL